MIKISVDATVVHLMVKDTINLSLRLSNDTYVDFPIYDESFPLVKAGKRFRLTLEEEVENEADGSLLEGTKPAAEAAKEVYRAMSDVFAETSKWDGKTPYHIIDELRRDVATLGIIKKAINQLEVRNEDRLASYPDAEIEAHRKRIQEVIMPKVKKVDELITGTAGEVNGKIKCHVCVHTINPSVCKDCINLSKFTPTSITSCKGCVHETTGEDNGTCSFCEEFNHFSLKEEVAAIPDEEAVNKEIYKACGIPKGVLRFAANEIKKNTKAWVVNNDPVILGNDFTPPINLLPICQGCKHIGASAESEPCDVCVEGSRYDDSHKGVLPLGDITEVNPDEEFKVPEYLIHQRVEIPEERILHKDEKPSSLIDTAKKFVNEVCPAPPLSEPIYSARRRKCGKCANSSNPSACIRCIDYSRFEPSRYK